MCSNKSYLMKIKGLIEEITKTFTWISVCFLMSYTIPLEYADS